jgi:hypothetical protein
MDFGYVTKFNQKNNHSFKRQFKTSVFFWGCEISPNFENELFSFFMKTFAKFWRMN